MNSDDTLHRVLYFETDRMGIVHHSNYVRWMEEARIEYMRSHGVDYFKIETQGVLMPVVTISCKYIVSARFDDIVSIHTTLTEYNGIRMKFTYKMYFKDTDTLICEGTSEHCFIDEQKRNLLNLKKRLPEEHTVISSLVKK